ncbi:MAG: hypothetical protein KGI57_10120 [Hyphomicrobiales bacterium]|nr:hypothetical protein [Hyphomicrobiales bacterium]MDE2018052.1 hypothetical protein [Hyphomicrobiales bacterium]
MHETPRSETPVSGPLKPGRLAFAALAAAVVAAPVAILVSGVPGARAVPSFARQTGQPCAACHTAFPELTPYGRRFKLGGYSFTNGSNPQIPVAAMVMPTFTHSAAPFDPGAQPSGLRTNDNLVVQQATGFLAGYLGWHVGAFIQATDNPITGSVALDASEIRYADQGKLFDKDLIYGVSINNTPTVQDVWNTTPAFSWPQIASGVGTMFGSPLTQIEGGFGQNSAGVGAYAFWNDMLYAELSAYRTMPSDALKAFGEKPPPPFVIDGVAPYWRIALEPHWGDHYLMIGTFGMYAREDGNEPLGLPTGPTNDYLDLGFDTQYQYDGRKFSVTAKVTDIVERQRLNAAFGAGNSTNLSDTLNSFKANATFVWDHTYALGAGYFNVAGSRDCLLYGANSATCSPNGDGLVFDASYIPFSKGAPWPYSTWNARLGVQYTKYLHVYGGTSNFDGSGLGGQHDASGKDTVLVYAWMAF